MLHPVAELDNVGAAAVLHDRVRGVPVAPGAAVAASHLKLSDLIEDCEVGCK